MELEVDDTFVLFIHVIVPQATTYSIFFYDLQFNESFSSLLALPFSFVTVSELLFSVPLALTQPFCNVLHWLSSFLLQQLPFRFIPFHFSHFISIFPVMSSSNFNSLIVIDRPVPEADNRKPIVLHGLGRIVVIFLVLYIDGAPMKVGAANSCRLVDDPNSGMQCTTQNHPGLHRGPRLCCQLRNSSFW